MDGVVLGVVEGVVEGVVDGVLVDVVVGHAYEMSVYNTSKLNYPHQKNLQLDSQCMNIMWRQH